MTDKQVRSDEARRNLRNLLDDAARGYHITILRYDKAAAVLVPVDWYEDAEAAWGTQLERDTGAAAFQLSEARDVLARWDAEQDGDPVIGREKVLADQIRTLLAIVDDLSGSPS